MDSFDPLSRVAPGGQSAVAVCVAEPSLQERICSALEAGGHPVQARHATIQALLGSWTGRQPACIVLAADRPDGAAIGPLHAIRSELGAAGAVLICGRARGGEIRRALELGVDGVLLESQIETALAAVVDVVCAGQVSVPSRRRFEVTARSLTTREKQILALVVAGLTNLQIAGRLYLAESTVKSHLSSAFSKLGVSSRYEAATMILDPERGRGLGVREIETGQLLQGQGV